MKTQKLKFYIFLSIFAIFSSCEQEYITNKMMKTPERKVDIEKLYDIYISDKSNFKGGDIIDEDKDFPFHLIDTTNIKTYQFELDYFTNEDFKDFIWSKTIFEIKFGKIKTENINHWFPLNCMQTGYSRNTEIVFETNSIFHLTFEESDTLGIFIRMVFELCGKGSKLITKRNGDSVTFSTIGPIISEPLNVYWNSIDNNLTLFEVSTEKNKLETSIINKKIKLPEIDENSLEDRILKKIFNTDIKLSKRFEIIEK